MTQRKATHTHKKPTSESPTPCHANPSSQFFSTLSDEDFFSDRVHHMYFYDPVTDETVFQLQQDIHAANQSSTINDVQVSPKPIVLHVNSPGGSVTSCMSMLTIFNQTWVPMCTMTDGYSCSAASLLTVASPYRVAASPHVFTLIHQSSSMLFGTMQEIQSQVSLMHTVSDSMIQIYLECTKLKEPQLKELMLRDLYLDTGFCKKSGIYDRVLDVSNTSSLASYRRQRAEYLDLPLHILLSKSNWNRFVFSTCRGDVQRLDVLLCAPQADTKPIIYYCTPRCYEHDPFYWLAMVARVKAMRVPMYSVIESVISIWDYLPSLFCMKRYMYSHGIIDIDLQYIAQYGRRLQDIRENTSSLMNVLKAVLREKTSLPESILKEIGDKRHTFNASQCVQYGLCDEIVPLKRIV